MICYCGIAAAKKKGQLHGNLSDTLKKGLFVEPWDYVLHLFLHSLKKIRFINLS